MNLTKKQQSKINRAIFNIVETKERILVDTSTKQVGNFGTIYVSLAEVITNLNKIVDTLKGEQNGKENRDRIS